MSRGLPFSVVLHLLCLVAVFVFGDQVSRRQFDPPRTIRVRTVQLPKPPAAKIEQPPAEEPKPEPIQQPVVEPDQPPKQVPDIVPEEKEPEKPKEEPKPKPKDVVPDPEPAVETPADDTVAEEPAAPVVTGPSVAGTDVDFPFAWYLSRVQGQISRNWRPRQMGFRNDAVVSCIVHFVIGRGGTVSQVTLTESSGIGVFDREALRVVQTSRFPQLPPRYTHSSLGISVVFNLESGY